MGKRPPPLSLLTAAVADGAWRQPPAAGNKRKGGSKDPARLQAAADLRQARRARSTAAKTGGTAASRNTKSPGRDKHALPGEVYAYR